MKSLWSDAEAAEYSSDLALRVYTSRLLGRDESLVLHGGGNTSVKICETNLVGDQQEILYVKGSGWDLVSIEEGGFAPVRMDHLLKLAKLPSLSDAEMVNELKTQCTAASAPSPSVETILHATLPYRYVDHTHADAVLSLCNTPDGEQAIHEIYGEDTVIIPYIMPGFDLARVCAERFAAEVNEKTVGMVLMNHGIFSFADNARESYERMIELVGRAERSLATKGAWQLDVVTPEPITSSKHLAHARLRAALSRVAGKAQLLSHQDDVASEAFSRRSDLPAITQQGPATPDHVIRTKQLPLLGDDVDGYVAAYQRYFDKHSAGAKTPVTMLNPVPKVVIDKTLGLCTVGGSAKETLIIGDIYRHTISIILRAEAWSCWQALPSQDVFDMEYWELEQAKLKKSGTAPPFCGEVALVTGAASGIGKACVDSMLSRGAAVIALDIDENVKKHWHRADVLALVCDVTEEQALANAVEQGVRRFGGLDMLVVNAGIFPGGRCISEFDMSEWRKVQQVNVDANMQLLKIAHPLLKLAPNGGRVVVMGSKNVTAPGPGASAYSASKAALTQVARIAALEWGGDNIRVNTLHPDCVFDTGIWTDEVLQARAAHYGVTVEQYKRKNILQVEVTSQNVAELVAECCGPLFSKTTGAQIPIDGGNDRVI
ncbi:Short-chain dehydrogenase [hydrothermal vent metagenome]|uniref:Short-chain dehydrogenase n=1 Tax=hydrothermal vent metagenome TaxID=652676 RepID=A0A3B0Z5Z1_9ZZZZ